MLALTVLFVMIAELLIFLPSISKYRYDYLQERLEMGQLAGLSAIASDPATLQTFAPELLENAEVMMVVLYRDGSRSMLRTAQPDRIDAAFDLREDGSLKLLGDALRALIIGGDRTIRVIGEARFMKGERVEVILDERLLCQAMLAFSIRIFWLSLAISAISAALMFAAAHRYLVGPMSKIIDSIVLFRDDPEDAERILALSGSSGEIGQAERELAETQREVRAALKQKSRLAALGEAVAKINHDLRNMLASAQLLADRLETSSDPMVARVSPKLINSLDRAIRLCQQTLAYGRASEPPPERMAVSLEALADDLNAAVGVSPGPGGLRVENRAPVGFTVQADPDQLFRALLNLARNSAQAIQTHKNGVGLIVLEARLAPGVDGAELVEIDLVDDGPGLPKQARKDLFKPFKGSAAAGGTGLGVAIAAELVRGHGGALDLVESSEKGTRFRLSFPQRAQRAAA